MILRSLHHVLLIALLPLACSAYAQTTYTQTLPTMEGSSLSSWHPFTFTGTPATTGEGTLNFQWRACWQAAFGGSSKIWIELKTGTTTYTQVYYETGNTAECAALSRTATIPASVLATALSVGNGNLIGRLKVQDSCYPGVGCSFYNDPQVLNFKLTYTVHTANFSAATPSICPGATVQFTDASLNTPSSYQWEFTGGQPATSTSQNPTVQYATAGTYDVTLTVVTANGIDVMTRPAFVTVHTPPAANAGVDNDLCAGSSIQLTASGGTSYQWFPATGLNNANIAAPMANPVNTTSYTVLVTDAHGCTASDNMILTVHAAPTVVASAGLNTICSGDTAHVVAVGAQLYQWSPNLFISGASGALVQMWPTSTFTWTLTGTDAFGCVAQSQYTLNVDPPPAAPVVTNDGELLSCTAATAYQWFLNGAAVSGADQQQWAPTVNGNYSVRITDANGCTAMGLPVFFGNVGLVNTTAPSVRTYPQPVHDRLTLEGISEKAHARIINVQGTTAWEGTVAEGNSTLDLSALAAGTYTLELRMSGSVQRIAVIKD